MGPSNRLHVRWQNLLLPGLILAMIAMALFLVVSVNASAASAPSVASAANAPNAPCTQIFDPRDIPSPKIITFDTLPGGTSLNTQYKTGYGVVFPIQNPAPVIHAVNAADPDTAKTPPNVARNVLLPGVPRAMLEIGFTFPRTYVGFYLGNGMAATGGSVIASIDVLDSNNVSLCSFRIQGVTLPHTTFAGVYDSAGRIARITIDYGQGSSPESIDNLYVAPGFDNKARQPLPKWTAIPTLPPTPGPTPTARPDFPAYALYAYKSPVLIAPILIKPDFSIFNIEITQGIQCLNGQPAGCPDDSLHLVLSKSTVARVYIKANDSFSHYNNVPVRLHIHAFGKDYAFDASGKSTSTINQANHDAAEFYFNAYGGGPTTIEFWAEVDPKHIYNTSYTNPTSVHIFVTFDNRRTMTVAGERLYYHPIGYTGPQYAGGWAVNGGAAQWWNQVLPLSDNAINYFVRSGYLNWTSNLSSGDAQHSLISTLNLMWIEENALSWWFGTGPFTGARHVYGWAPSQGYSGGHADMPIYPHAGGLGVVGIGSDAAGTDTDHPGSGALIFGHELTHDYNVYHTNTSDACGSNDGNSDFPYSNSSIQAFGFNPLTGKIYDPALTQDLMSYCPSGGSKQGWISPFTWTKMYGDLHTTVALSKPSNNSSLGNTVQPAAPTAFTQSLVVNATLNNPGSGTTHTGNFDSLQRIPVSGVPITITVGSYTVEERDGSGTLLFSQPFKVDFTSEYKPKGGALPPPPFLPGDTTAQDVSLFIPYADGTRTILLVYNGAKQEVLDTRSVSANPPQVTITSPTSPVAWPAGSTQQLKWTGTSLDDLALTYSIFYSNDGGQGWTILASGLISTTYDVIVDAMAGGSDVRFRVVASDGINTGFDETPATITIPNHAPIPLISEPVHGSFYHPGDLVVFAGIATDMEDGTLPDLALVWSDNVQGGLGTGPTLPINTLTPGKHIITLTAKDSYGIASSTTVELFVGFVQFLPVTRK